MMCCEEVVVGCGISVVAGLKPSKSTYQYANRKHYVRPARRGQSFDNVKRISYNI